MPVWLAVAAGGAAGSVARYQLTLALRLLAPQWPWGTLLVNVVGSLAIGALGAGFGLRPVPDWVRFGLMSGVLGGFTTFSAFSIDTLDLWRTQPAAALLNVLVNVALSLAACALGVWLARQAVAA
ncbi:MAG TPA: fluoride efflux transporter CrcB [Solimonas sp.]|nr:fluoride efflux transporter CrcB [Solimonas sp.]